MTEFDRSAGVVTECSQPANDNLAKQILQILDGRSGHDRLARLALPLLFVTATVSVGYAVITAWDRGIDILMFQDMGDAWLNARPPLHFYGPPPFSAVMFAPLALLSPGQLKVVWLLVNLAATAASLYLTIVLWGENWSRRVRFVLCAFFLSWAPFRVTLRNGQITIVTLALLLGALVARSRKRNVLAGVLLGLSLWKYPLSFPFPFYFMWKRDWKLVITSVAVPLLLTGIYAWRLGITVVDVVREYVSIIGGLSFANSSFLEGTTDLKPLVAAITGMAEPVPAVISGAVCVIALTMMAAAFRRTRSCEMLHFAVLALFSLWAVYHRSYDAVVCLIPAAALIVWLRSGEFVWAGIAGFVSLGSFVIGIHGLTAGHLGLAAHYSRLVQIGLHIERLIVFGLFWLFIWILLRHWASLPGSRSSTVNGCPAAA